MRRRLNEVAHPISPPLAISRLIFHDDQVPLRITRPLWMALPLPWVIYLCVHKCDLPECLLPIKESLLSSSCPRQGKRTIVTKFRRWFWTLRTGITLFSQAETGNATGQSVGRHTAGLPGLSIQAAPPTPPEIDKDQAIQRCAYARQ